MKITVRNGVFETNSSSTHSVSIRKTPFTMYYNDIEVSEIDNKVHTKLGQFGWGPEIFCDTSTRLSYLVTMLYCTEVKYDESNIEGTNGFKEIEDIVKNFCKCDGLVIENNVGDPYIDHQSCEDYHSINDFLDDYGLSIEEFIFSPCVELIIDNDNH